MADETLDELLGVAHGEDAPWEVFHENSKNLRSAQLLRQRSAPEVQREMRRFHESLPYAGYAALPLPPPRALTMPLGQAVVARCSTRGLAPNDLALEQVAALLHYAYGMLRDNHYVAFPSRTRAVASAGALYPLELYFHAGRVDGLAEGLYHYSPKDDCLHRLGPLTQQQVCAATNHPDLVSRASLTLFVTALFERSTWKYGARGYRYALMEAGAVSHAVGLAAAALQLGCFNLGGYIDQEIDDLLELDGVTHTTLGLLCVGGL